MFLFILVKIIDNFLHSLNNKKILCSFTQLTFTIIFGPLFSSGIIFRLTEGLPLIFLIVSVCWSQILLFCVSENFFVLLLFLKVVFAGY